MRCTLCGDKGVIRIGYREEPAGYVDYGVCTCARGHRFRSDMSMDALAAKYGVHPDQVNLVEALLDPEDLPGFQAPAPAVIDVTDAGRSPRKAKL